MTNQLDMLEVALCTMVCEELDAEIVEVLCALELCVDGALETLDAVSAVDELWGAMAFDMVAVLADELAAEGDLLLEDVEDE